LKAIVLVPELILRPNETGVFEQKINVSVLNGTELTFDVRGVRLVRLD